MATDWVSTLSQPDRPIGIAEIHTISGGLTSTTSTYSSRPAIQRRATYSSQATSSFIGERIVTKSTTTTTSPSSSRLIADARRLPVTAGCQVRSCDWFMNIRSDRCRPEGTQ